MRQFAPHPDDLDAAVAQFRYMDGWEFELVDIDRDFEDAARTKPIAGGLTFTIVVPCHDAYHPENYRPVIHYHPVPAATFNRASWERWIFDRLMDTIRHEAAEFARFESVIEVTDGEDTWPTPGAVRRPFAPTHGPGDDPYVLHEYASDLQRRTSYRGDVNS